MNKQKGFTIVELLTSIVIIALLLGLLLPSLAKIRRSAKEAAQKAQFTTIDTAIEAFKQDYGDYPPSDLTDGAGSGISYCGASKLVEALLGFDLRGFNPTTVWSYNGCRDTAVPCNDPVYSSTDPNLRERKGPYLDAAKTSVFHIGDLYPNYATAPLDPANLLICDVFGVKKIKDTSGKIVNAGTPILYYRANTNYKGLVCPVSQINAAKSVYNYYDNLDILSLGVLPNLTAPHKMYGIYFCNPSYKIVDTRVAPWIVGSTTTYWPNRPDSYILISAGADHNFGTEDDILNF
jgi:prepilin-type N-terminal cleavage/methylation domain-containing protein